MSSGTQDNITGKAKEAVGDLTDDSDLQNEGKADQAAGTVKEKHDKVDDKVDDIKERISRN